MSAFDGFVNFHPIFVHAPVVLIPTAAVMVSATSSRFLRGRRLQDRNRELRLPLHPEVSRLHIEVQPVLLPLRALEVHLVLEDGPGFLDEELEVIPVPFLE